MKTVTFLLISIFFLSGCFNSKEIVKIVNVDKLHEQSLLYTQKGEVVSSFETKAIIFATYLNPLDEKFHNENNDSFLVGVYIPKDYAKKAKRGLKNPLFKLINGDNKKPLSVKRLNRDDELMKFMPIVNSWCEYFKVDFKTNKKVKKIKLIYQNKDYGKTILNFSKEY